MDLPQRAAGKSGLTPSIYYYFADWLTKGKCPRELNERSLWQMGPGFIALEESLLPIKQKCAILEIPESIRNVMSTMVQVREKLAPNI